ncbi:hypothetical protein CL633_02680 [bacterium]|nr:hypothetical protein [bacterium]|tara:strand:+ start:113 stop:784 length:672 start_codon:yes stop_codon:yes gene_type:complete
MIKKIYLAKIVISAFLGISFFFIVKLFSLVPAIGILLIIITMYSLFILPPVWISYICLTIIFEKKKIKFMSIIMGLSIILFFKLGILWLSWFLAFILTIIFILLTIKWFKEKNNNFLRIFLGIFGVILICSLYLPLNPFVSFFGFFNTGKLISMNIKYGNPSNLCQKEKWNCNSESECNDFDNIKNCYCSECVQDLKFCQDCFFFWDNNYACNAFTEKCTLGW